MRRFVRGGVTYIFRVAFKVVEQLGATERFGQRRWVGVTRCRPWHPRSFRCLELQHLWILQATTGVAVLVPTTAKCGDCVSGRFSVAQEQKLFLKIKRAPNVSISIVYVTIEF